MAINDCWYRKYEPRKLEDMILSSSMKKFVEGVIKRGGLSNPIILHGKYGHGKTALGKLLVRLIKLPNKIIIGNTNSDKAYIKTEVMNFLNIQNSKHKILLFDEFDRFSREAKEMLKPLITATATSCSYIFTTNHIENIPTAITKSRAQVISMIPRGDEIEKYEIDIQKRLIHIMKNEGYKPTKDDLPLLKKLVQHVPDYNIRGMILLLQSQLEFEGKLTDEMFESHKSLSYELLDLIKNGKIEDVRKKVMEVDTTTFLRFLFDNAFTIFIQDKIEMMGRMLGEYNFTIPSGIDDKIGLYGLCCDLRIQNKKSKIFVS